jgi:hypothetical protein
MRYSLVEGTLGMKCITGFTLQETQNKIIRLFSHELKISLTLKTVQNNEVASNCNTKSTDVLESLIL